LVRKVTHAWKRNPWADRDELLHRCRGPRRNHLCQLLWLSLMGFERGGGQSLGFSIDLHRRPYNTLALPCECVIGSSYSSSFHCNYGRILYRLRKKARHRSKNANCSYHVPFNLHDPFEFCFQTTLGPVIAWIGDGLWTGKPPRRRTRRPGLLSLSPPSVDRLE